jgi:hypothetical protein
MYLSARAVTVRARLGTVSDRGRRPDPRQHHARRIKAKGYTLALKIPEQHDRAAADPTSNCPRPTLACLSAGLPTNIDHAAGSSPRCGSRAE